MSKIHLGKTRELLQAFELGKLFVEELGWSSPKSRRPLPIEVDGQAYTLREVAQLGAKVFEIEASDGNIPAEKKIWLRCYEEVAKLHHEHLLIFVDKERQQSVWLWGKREGAKLYLRDHLYDRNQPGDLFLSKLAALAVDISELGPGGEILIVEVAGRLRQALDVERVTKRFYTDYQQEHLDFLDQIAGIASERDRRWYASVLLNRLMFIYFLQRKSFLDGGDIRYLRTRLEASRQRGNDLYYREFLRALFFEGFAKPEAERTPEVQALLGDIRYLNGGLFLPHRIESENPAIRIPDQAFENLLALFERYSWNLDDTPGGQDDEINPDVLGYIFEKYINQKAFGAYYTRPEITEYLCEQTLHKLILERVNRGPAAHGGRRFESVEELLLRLDADLCRDLLLNVLPSLRILDPACGSGAFLVAALKTLINIYSLVLGRVDFLRDRNLNDWLAKARADHPSLNYFIKKKIITDNLFGVDLMEEATEIARLRLFLALVSSATRVEELEPLPNIDFNILNGNSLIGLLHVDAHEFEEQLSLFSRPYKELLAEKNRMVDIYRHSGTYAEDLRSLRDDIERQKKEAKAALDQILLGKFENLKIRYEQATWDPGKNREGKPEKRALREADLARLEPFHWGYEFDQVLAAGGFDAILTNPPWEAWKPQAKEFFAEHSELVTKNIMSIKDFEKEKEKLLEDPEVRAAWLEYQSRFPHVSAYYRSARQYENQISVVNGKKAGSDTNLYKLFVEQCFNLLREGGRCGILVPTGIYTDLGTKQLREMLFGRTKIECLFGLSNERFLFEGVDHRFRICLLAFEKGGETDDFPAAFRINPREAIAADRLAAFLHSPGEHLRLSVELVQRLSPDSFSVVEFKNESDIRIAARLLKFPPLGELIENKWKLQLTAEFHMTNDSRLYHSEVAPGRLPLCEGKMIHQFRQDFAAPRYWVDENEARAALLKKEEDTGQIMGYQQCRLAFRDVARDSDERTMIATILPPKVFCPHTMTLELIQPGTDGLDARVRCYLVGLFNSFAVDYLLRQRVTAHLSLFLVYNLPVPRLAADHPQLLVLAKRAAKLVCTTEDFAELWQKVTGEPWTSESGATDAAERARLRAEIDGLVAHLYGLSEEEFAHILATFPVVAKETKAAALEAYRAFAPKTADPILAPILLAGEGARIEYKSTLRWDLKEKKKNPLLEAVILKTVAGFLNAQGGTLLVGVDDDGNAVGLEHDYALVQKKNRDGFELYLTDLLSSLGKDLAPCFSVHFHQLEGKDICRIEIAPAPRFIVVNEAGQQIFYLRTLNSTRKLSPSEMLDYATHRWPK